MIKNLDIIIPVYAPGESFERELRLLNDQTFPYSHLIAVLTLSKDKDKDERALSLLRENVAEDRLILRKISREEFDHASSRRLGVSLSETDAFICMTDDALPQDKYFTERLKAALERDERIALAYARQVSREDASGMERFSRQFNYPDRSVIKSKKDAATLGIKAYFASNVAAIYSRALYDKIGGFEDFALFNEDMVFAARAIEAGYMVYYKADAAVIHSHNLGLTDAMKRSFDNGMSQSMNSEIFDIVSPTAEGIKYLKSGIDYLSSENKSEIPMFVLSSGLRFIGFKLGKNYFRLPRAALRVLSSDPALAMRALEEERS